MERFDIYKSEGGYRVAEGVYNDCPVIDLSAPWFADKAKAAEYREKCIRDEIKWLEDHRWEWPADMIDSGIATLRGMLGDLTEEG